MHQIVSSISEGILRFHRPILVVVLVLVLVTLAYLPKLKIDNSISSWYKQDDPALLEYNHFLKTFGSDDVIVNCIYDTLPYSHPDRIASTIRFTEDLKKIKGVSVVSAYTNFPYWYLVDGYRTLENMDTLPLVSDVEIWMESIDLKNRLVGKSANFVFIYAWPDTSNIMEKGRNSVIAAIDSIFVNNYETPKNRLYKGGLGVVYDGINQTTLTEGKIFLGLSYLVLIVAMLLISRSYFITFLSLVTIGCATLFLMGAMLATGKPINTMTLALPPLIMVIGVSNFIHFTLHTRQEVGTAINDNSRIFSAITLLSIPIFFNVLTTVGGFLSLTSSAIEITKDYGILAAMSEFFVSLLSFIAIVIFHKKLLKANFKFDPLNAISFRVDAIMNWSSRHYKAVITATLFVIFASLTGISRINIDTKPLSFIPKKHAIKEGHDLITREIGNYISLEFVLKFKKSSWKAKKNLILLDEVQQLVATDSSVSSTLSILDFITDAYQRTPGHKLDPGEDLSHISQTKLSQISGNIGGEPFIQRLATPDGDELRVLAGIPFTSANQFKAIHQRISQKISAKFGDQIEFRASGYIPLYARIVDTVLSDQIKSIALAIVVIYVLIFIVLGSLKLALLAMPSNLIPILIILGLMGWAGIPLDIVTVTLAATILAIIVDDTLHMLFAYKRLLAKGHTTAEATNLVAKLTGSAVVSASIILLLGYSILAISSVPILSTTGLLMVVAIVTGLLADLFLLPALLKVSGDKGG
ncbi:MAG: MMPL family transporter [Lewinellaceae bacterium]|nr:MMPL family transporter [Saprospiraceae bacterium]MCB9341297.1 MMPL family transporter [Lewinellaceae bacterium]